MSKKKNKKINKIKNSKQTRQSCWAKQPGQMFDKTFFFKLKNRLFRIKMFDKKKKNANLNAFNDDTQQKQFFHSLIHNMTPHLK